MSGIAICTCDADLETSIIQKVSIPCQNSVWQLANFVKNGEQRHVDLEHLSVR